MYDRVKSAFEERFCEVFCETVSSNIFKFDFTINLTCPRISASTPSLVCRSFHGPRADLPSQRLHGCKRLRNFQNFATSSKLPIEPGLPSWLASTAAPELISSFSQSRGLLAGERFSLRKWQRVVETGTYSDTLVSQWTFQTSRVYWAAHTQESS